MLVIPPELLLGPLEVLLELLGPLEVLLELLELLFVD
jgi:hypothetical protein